MANLFSNYLSGAASGLAGLGRTVLGIPGELLQGVSNTIFPKSKDHADFDTWCTSIGGQVVTGADGKKTCSVSHPMEITQDHHAQMLKHYNGELMYDKPADTGSLYSQVGAQEFLKSLQPPGPIP